jgi:hypothetical protein
MTRASAISGSIASMTVDDTSGTIEPSLGAADVVAVATAAEVEGDCASDVVLVSAVMAVVEVVVETTGPDVLVEVVVVEVAAAGSASAGLDPSVTSRAPEISPAAASATPLTVTATRRRSRRERTEAASSALSPAISRRSRSS